MKIVSIALSIATHIEREGRRCVKSSIDSRTLSRSVNTYGDLHVRSCETFEFSRIFRGALLSKRFAKLEFAQAPAKQLSARRQGVASGVESCCSIAGGVRLGGQQ